MRKLYLFIVALVLAQPIWVQAESGVRELSGQEMGGAVAPLFVLTNGPGRVFVFDQHSRHGASQEYPVGSRYLLVAVPDPGCEFVGWNELNVLISTTVVTNVDGSTTVISTPIIDPGPVSDFRYTLMGEVQPEMIVVDTPLLEITATQGWEANFERRRPR